MKVHRVSLLVVDHNDIGVDDIKIELEQTNYPGLVAPTVLGVETRDVEWSDRHPLNLTDTNREAAAKLFGADLNAMRLLNENQSLRSAVEDIADRISANASAGDLGRIVELANALRAAALK
jgi:hypothetical protein